jgi:transposase
VNAQHIKRVPGRKTDVMDAEWLAQLLHRGLVNPSFIPPREQRALRDLVRYRQSLVEEQTRVSNRIEKVLEDANIKLAAVVTRLQGVSACAILHALLEGTRTPEPLADLAKGTLRRKREALVGALDSVLQAQHIFLLTHLLAHLDFLDEEVAAVEAELTSMVAALPAYQDAVDRLDTIPGVNVQMATLIVAEIGVDMRRFPTDKQLTAWAGLAPGNNETGGKQRPTRTRQGNKHLKRALVQAAQAAARTKESYLRAL